MMKMADIPKVYYGSTIVGRPARYACLSAKLDSILEHLDLSTIEKKDKVAIKMHLGFNDGYQTVPVYFVRRVAEAVKKQGAFPFVTDNPSAVYNAADRGYTSETCGCPIIPISGVKDGYVTKKEIDFNGLDSLDAAGVLLDADVLINLTHVKGHGSCGYGGAFKNIALGGYGASSRWHKIHGVEQFLKYFDETKMTKEHLEKLREVCPRNAPSWNEKDKKAVLSFYECDQCHGKEKPCIEADNGLTGWSVKEENFVAFQEIMAIAAKHITDSFDAEKMFHLNFMMDITPFCDCMGMGMPSVIEDIGIAGSKDIVAVETASLDLIAQQGLLVDTVKKIPEAYMRSNPDGDSNLHPWQLLHGPFKNPYKVAEYGADRGMGSMKYELVELLSAEETSKGEPPKIEYEGGPTFY
jgi:uncharacterized Fe-S center protein